MSDHVNTNEARTMGRYALLWVQASDWYKTHMHLDAHAKSKSSQPGKQQAENSEEKKLKNVVKESNMVLVKAQTVFPFTLRTSHLTLDRHKLTLIYRRFFGAQQTVSVPIENIKNIQANVGPLFGSLTITSDQFINNTQHVHYLTRRDALKVQRVIQGAIVATSEKIDLNKVEAKKLRKLLEDLGGSHALQR